MIITLSSQTAVATLTHEGGGVIRWTVEEFSQDEMTHTTSFDGVVRNRQELMDVLLAHFNDDELMDIYSILKP